MSRQKPFSQASTHPRSLLLSLSTLLPLLLLAISILAAGTSAAAPPTPPAYTPVVTPAPNQAAALAAEGYSQATYYTCEADGGCGWHVPLVKVEGGAAAGARMGVAVGMVVVLTAVFVAGLL